MQCIHRGATNSFQSVQMEKIQWLVEFEVSSNCLRISARIPFYEVGVFNINYTSSSRNPLDLLMMVIFTKFPICFPSICVRRWTWLLDWIQNAPKTPPDGLRLAKHRRCLFQHVQDKPSLQAPLGVWWIIAVALLPVFDSISMTLATIQTQKLVISQQRQEVANLIFGLCINFGIRTLADNLMLALIWR